MQSFNYICMYIHTSAIVRTSIIVTAAECCGIVFCNSSVCCITNSSVSVYWSISKYGKNVPTDDVTVTVSVKTLQLG